MSDGDILISIDDDEGGPVAGRKQKMTTEARAARVEAEGLQWRRQAQVERTARVVEVADREYDTIVSGIAATQTEIAQAEVAQFRAMEDGQFAGAAKSANSRIDRRRKACRARKRQGSS